VHDIYDLLDTYCRMINEIMMSVTNAIEKPSHIVKASHVLGKEVPLCSKSVEQPHDRYLRGA